MSRCLSMFLYSLFLPGDGSRGQEVSEGGFLPMEGDKWAFVNVFFTSFQTVTRQTAPVQIHVFICLGFRLQLHPAPQDLKIILSERIQD